MRVQRIMRWVPVLLAAAFLVSGGHPAEKSAVPVFVPLSGDGEQRSGERELYLLARACAAFAAEEPDAEVLCVLSGVGQMLCNRVSDERFPDTLASVCLDAFPEALRDGEEPAPLYVSAAENALCSPGAVGDAVFVSRAGEAVPGRICAVIGGFVFSA